MANLKHQNSALGCTVFIADGKFEQGLRKFKNKVQDSGLLLELKSREAYEKPTAVRKRKAAQARKRWEKKQSSSQLAPKKF